ncbi:hypothetical protein GM418_27535 [Maribellus comscasis]|uniref:TerB family tellurite resistance protein n=1 Tax=Maribellus comscasis TaxID=2681766 RepID=A0A6I6JXK2_9BACT|nr:hypothetical protein [Maribellus comscasis]QGY47281.1 hypothetical protein GM418_27535 [Maribellus comscasis]
MNDLSPKWTTSQLRAYLLLYCANIDLKLTDKEKENILSKINKSAYSLILEEFESDNDFQRLEKIKASVKQFNYPENFHDLLSIEIKELFLSDGDFSQFEQFVYLELDRILKM